ncbi:MAG: hypothetical protein LBU32_05085 [Clostridiales bacterium]|nr:hypothetical protein [Clostridiales bacterium]
MKRPWSSAFPCAASVKIASGRAAAGRERMLQRWMAQVHPAHRSDKNPEAVKTRHRPDQAACRITQLPRRHH